MAEFIKRVTVIKASDGTAETIYRSKSKKKKISRWLKPREKFERRMASAMETFGAELGRRHDRSNAKKENGFLVDRANNVRNANRKAVKKLFK